MARRGAPSRLTSRLQRAPTRYEPIRRIAAGGMAEVWEAVAIFEDGEGYPVAIKRVLPQLATQELYRSMFIDEARLGMLLRHENIVRVYDAREVAGTFLMVMELVDGASLKALLTRAHERGAPMPVATALHISLQLAKGLEYAHTARDDQRRPLGIIHRDVSPHNLLLSRQGEVKLTDFGLADASVHQTQLDEALLGGKLGYLAPEIVRGQPSTHRIDLFALGIVLWEMLCGRRLFVGATDQETVRAVAAAHVPAAQALNPRVPDLVQQFLDEVLAPEPAHRTTSAAEAVGRMRGLIAYVDPEVGARDVALLVGLHLATEAIEAPSAPAALTDVIAHELQAFSEQAAEEVDALGAAPLDPDAFG